ncbi:hypothetical protein B0I72DRAFT_105117 [Yarrowia lipolytica]|uniref:non-specific serine/threonine protein kinase n=2 Tax=Yarrowia lipolytica TaxID=4952 RepID=Q6C0Z0_YARLI|nr:YALI0F20636p [Yarrowia lipolytica CLIB122]RDW25352.1 hypothetical protein B0I71DRAFT_119771 [Yarrowia lipolytica]RDW35954.1 hypothetical protein B0I72DRAFT_105117 [Yarrowia lipolytica]RDW42261.1 hypothetical protein B0I73DRAFT_112753 [Yarrowia lipolytica]RDW49490.1 hypothetical protein B0I74DRAFT_170875 [Yarrowia lipolytica]RDW55508.1 hypothetical protein B0I75DRAFT_97696 [Yarrowia lipolytica]|eukprot:XP_505672.1 YALI0F20636p [Yarrowia lipolytica CLIB122]
MSRIDAALAVEHEGSIAALRQDAETCRTRIAQVVQATLEWKQKTEVEDLWMDLLTGDEYTSYDTRASYFRTMDRYGGITYLRLAKVWKMAEHSGWGGIMGKDLLKRVDEEATKYKEHPGCLVALISYLTFDVDARDYAVDRMLPWFHALNDDERYLWYDLLEVLVKGKTHPPPGGLAAWTELYVLADADPNPLWLGHLLSAASLWGWDTTSIVGDTKYTNGWDRTDGYTTAETEDLEFADIDECVDWIEKNPGDPRAPDYLADFASHPQFIGVIDTMDPSDKISYWAAAAKKATGATLSYSLYSLVEYFAQDDELLRSRAVAAVVGAAWVLEVKPLDLLGQFWEVIGLFAARKKVCDVLAVCVGVSNVEMSRLIERYVVPIGVLEERGLIDYLAELSSTTVAEVVRRNIPEVIAAAVIKYQRRYAGEIKEMLDWAGIQRDVHDIYAEHGVRSRVLLSILCRWEEADSEPVDAALGVLATWGNTNPESLLKGTMLSLMLHVANILENPHTVDEKTSALRALQKVTLSVSKEISAIFPQLFVCLQSAIEVPELRSSCVELLICLGKYLPEEHYLIASLFTGWLSLIGSRDRQLINKSGIALSEHPKEDADEHLAYLISTPRHDNVYVARRVLMCLQTHLFTNISKIQSDKRPAAALLVRWVQEFAHQSNDVAYLACVNLGVLNSPRTLNMEKPPHPVVVDWSGPERREFCIYLLTNVLSKCYSQSTEVQTQQYIAIGIQEILRKEQLTKEEWSRIDNETRLILTPLTMSTFYVGKDTGKRKDRPVCSEPYEDWIINYCRWLTNLIMEQGSLAEKEIYEMLLPTMKQSPEIATFLFPYLFACVVVHCKTATRKELNLSITEILSRSLTHDFYRTVFRVVDYLIVYMQHLLAPPEEGDPADKKDLKLNATRQRAKRVDTFLQRIDSEQLVDKAMVCESYSRTVLYLDTAVRRVPEMKDEVYQKLFKVYSEMKDTDALAGIVTKMESLSPQQQVDQYEGLKKWDLALSCWSVEHFHLPKGKQYFNCLLNAHRYETLLHEAEKSLICFENESVDITVEAAWRLGNVDKVREWCDIARSRGHESYSTCMAQAMIAFGDGDTDCVSSQIRMARNFVKRDLVNPHTLSLSFDRLHALADFESVAKVAECFSQDHRSISEALDKRLEDVSDQLYILDIRKFIFSVSKLPFATVEVAHIWTKLAAQYRHAGRVELATAAALQGMVYTPRGRMEYAQLQWQEGDMQGALRTLEKDRGHDGEVALLYAGWLAQSGHVGFSVASKTYIAATELAKTEKAYYELARFYHGVIQDQDGNNKVNEYENGQLTLTMITALVSALQLGNKYATETLPMLLSAWLDMGDEESPKKSGTLARINSLISSMHQNIPASTFYAGMSQMTARIAMDNAATLDVMNSIMIHVCEKYTDRTIWHLLSLSQSSNATRKSRGSNLLRSLRQNPNINKNTVDKSEKFALSLRNTLRARYNSKQSQVRVTKDLGFNPKLVPCPLCVPCEDFMSNTNAQVVSIIGVREKVTIMRSLQHPFKITLVGSDGKDYPVLLKNKDDVRKDARLLEITQLVDKLLAKNTLGIKTYFVTPLGDSCGLIEWVSGSVTAKSVILRFYEDIDWGTLTEQLEYGASRGKKTGAKVFLKILKNYQPELYRWFLEKFSEPHKWLRARDKFTKSLAVMSIVGYVLGLGDRHLENILLLGDGGVMHVDFDNLFEKALSLTKPEMVPFRLTQNLVDAMGVTGYEGHFRRSCESTLALLRQHEYTIMTALESFVHDPINDWKSGGGDSGFSVGPRRQASGPKEALSIVRKKIQGVVPQEALPLSVSGEVEHLIQDAINPENLSLMYVGWLPMM